MADIACTAAQVAPASTTFEVKTYKAAAAIAKGQAVYLTNVGAVNLADAAQAPTMVKVGIALSNASAGQAVEVIRRGPLNGYDLAGLAYGAAVYVSAAVPGSVADAAGAIPKIIGYVDSSTDGPNTKVLMVCPEMAEA